MTQCTGVLSEQDIRRRAPSAFAIEPDVRMSARYSLISTWDVLQALQNEGWYPTTVRQTATRDGMRRSYAKHLVRLRHCNDVNMRAVVGEVVPEIVLLNSHDGSSSYQLHAGLYRFVCSNGMVVSDGLIGKQTIRHSGNVIDSVIQGVYEIVGDIPTLTGKVDEYRSTVLDDEESVIFAKAALQLRYGDEPPIAADQLLRPRRYEDARPDLWTRFNVIQEHILKGGNRAYASNGRRTTTKAITSVNEDVRLNKALWTLADEMARLKNKQTRY